MDKVEEILSVLENLRKVWHDDTTLGYLIEIYKDYLKSTEDKR